jgi:hypothetical protein
MKAFEQATVSGSLFEGRRGVEVGGWWSVAPDVVAERTEVPGWSHLVLTSTDPLLPDDQEGATQYRYHFLVRESGARFLLVSAHAELVFSLLGYLGRRERVLTPSVDVPRITMDLVKKPGGYCLGAVFARVDGYGQSIRSVALYGNDLGEAQLFSDLLPHLVPYRVHLRDVRTGLEVLSIGSKGEVAFFYRGSFSLRSVDMALGFLNRQGYLSWSSEVAEAQIRDA